MHSQTAWQGGVYVEIAANRDAAEAASAQITQLMDRIIFSLPSAEPPLLARIVPPDRRERCRIWLVRTTRAIKSLEFAAMKDVDFDRLDQLLGLNVITTGPGAKASDVTLSIAAIEVVPGDPHLIWMAEYPTHQAAAAAFSRYSEAIKRRSTELDKSTALEEPRGRYLPGTWTRQQEALQPLLPLLLTALPDSEPAMTRPATAAALQP